MNTFMRVPIVIDKELLNAAVIKAYKLIHGSWDYNTDSFTYLVCIPKALEQFEKSDKLHFALEYMMMFIRNVLLVDSDSIKQDSTLCIVDDTDTSRITIIVRVHDKDFADKDYLCWTTVEI